MLNEALYITKGTVPKMKKKLVLMKLDEKYTMLTRDIAKHSPNHATMCHRLGCNSSTTDEAIIIMSEEEVTIRMAIP